MYKLFVVLIVMADAAALVPTLLIDSTYRDASCSPLQVCLGAQAATPLAR
jgi:hypothetical protein